MNSSENECASQKDAKRASVIFFHGLTKKSLTTSDNIFADRGTTERERCFDIHDDDLASKSSRKQDTDMCLQSPERLQTEDEEEDRLKKRHRTSFTSFQLKRLEDEFERESYIVGMKRWKLSEELEIPEKQIKIWFQNKRTKVKKLR